MGKPLLTDEIIERANRGESFDQTEPFTENEDREATKIIETSPRDAVKHEEKRFFDSLKKEDEKDQMVYKSRRIENVKRSEFQSKLNKLLLVIILLLAILIFAILKL